MRYECVKCRKVYEDEKIILVENDRFKGGLAPFCEDCYNKLERMV